ncbi:MAG TPA: hypothetical protein P5552_14040 [Candidatus Competibacteraceae bacterium]|nr:hypothetical protein [Candidatus Competibacteraceae bacterium]
MGWVGYKVHLTETCDPDTPHLIVNVETTPATTPDDNRIAVIHASLAQRNPLPAVHLVDKGYTSAQVLLDSQRDDQVAIVGPLADDPSGQARADEGFAKADFQVDGDRPVVTGPAGHPSGSWLPKPRFPGSWWRPVFRVRIARHVRIVSERKKNSKRPLEPVVAYLMATARKAVETTGSLIERLLPKHIPTVTAAGFELKVAFFILACSLNFVF